MPLSSAKQQHATTTRRRRSLYYIGAFLFCVATTTVSSVEVSSLASHASSLRRKLATFESTTTHHTHAESSGNSNSIVGGSLAALGEFPFLAVFQGDDSVLCGGVLISSTRILTAGHCLAYGAPSAVRIGSTSLTSGGEVIEVTCGIKHPDYKESPFGTVINDIAILKLTQPVTTTTSYAPINTDPQYPNELETPMVVAGFGKIANDGPISQSLQKVDTFFVTRDECLKKYSRVVVRSEAHICGDVPQKGGTYLCILYMR